MGGPEQVTADRIALSRDVMHFAAGLLRMIRRARRVMRKRPLRAANVGHAHRRELHSAQLLRRKRDRHAENTVEDAVVAQHAPKRLALPQHPHIRPPTERKTQWAKTDRT